MSKYSTHIRSKHNRYKSHLAKLKRHEKNDNDHGVLLQYTYLYRHFPEKEDTLNNKRSAYINVRLKALDVQIYHNPGTPSLHNQKAFLLFHAGKTLEGLSNIYMAHCYYALHEARLSGLTLEIPAHPPSYHIKVLTEGDLYSAANVLAAITREPIPSEHPRKTFTTLEESKYFRPIIELAALEKHLSILTYVIFATADIISQYWHKNTTLSFRAHTETDTAIHELCHYAERVTGIINRKSRAIYTARKKDKLQYNDSTRTTSDIGKKIYECVVIQPENAYSSSEQNDENISRLAEMITQHGKDAVKSALPNLYHFYKHIYLPAVRDKLFERKEALLDEAVIYITERIFLPHNMELFGKSNKSLTKRSLLEEDISEQLQSVIRSDNSLLSRVTHAISHTAYKTLDNIIESYRERLFHEGCFMYKNNKNSDGRKYISIQPQNFKKETSIKSTHTCFTERIKENLPTQSVSHNKTRSL